MQPVSATFHQAVTKRHRRVARVSALDASFQPIAGGVLSGEQGYIIEGSVLQDRRRVVRRSCSFSVANPDGVWTPRSPLDFFYWGNLIRIERGIIIGGQAEYASLGVFVIDAPELEVSASGSSVMRV